jgi:anti-sigma factor RsiW
MTGHEYDLEVGDYVDGTLAPARVAAFEAHLATCAHCQAMATDFRTLRHATAHLETLAPPPFVWTRVAAEITSTHHRRGFAWLPADLTWRSAVAAGVLVAVLGAGSWLSWRQVAHRGGARQVAEHVQVADEANAGGHVEAAEAMQAQISSLQSIIRTDSSILPAETKAVFDAASSEIDDAIGQPRAVLDQEPSNQLARVSLFDALRSKLALLQEMIALINQMRQGNQDEAARIVSGMQP